MTNVPAILRLKLHYISGFTQIVDIKCEDAVEAWEELRPQLHKLDTLHTGDFWVRLAQVQFIECMNVK